MEKETVKILQSKFFDIQYNPTSFIYNTMNLKPRGLGPLKPVSKLNPLKKLDGKGRSSSPSKKKKSKVDGCNWIKSKTNR